MQKRLIFVLLLLICFSLTCLSVGFVAVNSRGELIQCSDNNCVSFNSQEMNFNGAPKDYFHAVNYSSGWDDASSKVQNWFTNYRLAVIGNLAFALDYDGNIWECNLSSKNCRELNLGINGFRVTYNGYPEPTLEKNITYIVSANNLLYITGVDGKCAAVWTYEPFSEVTQRIFIEPTYCGAPNNYNLYSFSVPLFKNDLSIGFVVNNKNNAESCSYGYRAIKVIYSGAVITGTYKGVCYNGRYLTGISNGVTGGIMHQMAYGGDGGYAWSIYYPAFIYADSTFDNNQTVATDKALSKNGFAVNPVYSCGVNGIAKINTIYHNVYADIPIIAPGYSNPANCDFFKDGNFSSYFIVAEETFWFTHKTGVSNQIGACRLTGGAFSCTLSATNVPLSGGFSKIRFGNTIFAKKADGSGVYACEFDGININCATLDAPPKTYSVVNSDYVFFNNSFNVADSIFVSLALGESVFDSANNKYYALDSIGTLWSCSVGSCFVANQNVLFQDIYRLTDFGEDQNVILARDTGGKLWNCSFDGSGCTLISTDRINLQNIKVIPTSGLFSSGCSSYHIPNSDCSNNCNFGFKKLNDVCVPVGNKDLLGIYFYSANNIFRCVQGGCATLPTIGKTLTSFSLSKKRGVVSIFDSNRVLECYDNNCFTRYIQTDPTFSLQWVLSEKDGFFIYSYKSANKSSKLYWVDYGTTLVTPILISSWTSTFNSEGGGPSFDNGVFLSDYSVYGWAYSRFCNKFGCSSIFNFYSSLKPSNIGGAYSFNYDSSAVPRFFWANGLQTNIGSKINNNGPQTSPLPTGSIVAGLHPDYGYLFSVISPYFIHSFNSTVFPFLNLVAYRGVIVKGKEAWLVKTKPTLSYPKDKISYCTEYGCVNACTDTNFNRVDTPINQIVSYPKYFPEYEAEVLGYAINDGGKIWAIYKTDYYSTPECVDLDWTSAFLVASSDGGAFSINNNILSYCSFVDGCKQISSVKFESSTAVADESGGLFIFKYTTSPTIPKTPYYCNSSSCMQIAPSSYIFNGIVSGYQSNIISIGDGFCSSSEDLWSSPNDCNGAKYSNCCGANAKKYLATETNWVGTSYNYFCPDTNNSSRTFPNCICIALWDPVCGSNGKTYSNFQCASCDGIISTTPGACAPPEGQCKATAEDCLVDSDCCSNVCSNSWIVSPRTTGLCKEAIDEPSNSWGCLCPEHGAPVCEATSELPTLFCGNGNVDKSIGEVCDDTNLDGKTCSSLGLGSGVLSCNPSCGFDTSNCSTCETCLTCNGSTPCTQQACTSTGLCLFNSDVNKCYVNTCLDVPCLPFDSSCDGSVPCCDMAFIDNNIYGSPNAFVERDMNRVYWRNEIVDANYLDYFTFETRDNNYWLFGRCVQREDVPSLYKCGSCYDLVSTCTSDANCCSENCLDNKCVPITCGNKTCDSLLGETIDNCPQDCTILCSPLTSPCINTSECCPSLICKNSVCSQCYTKNVACVDSSDCCANLVCTDNICAYSTAGQKNSISVLAATYKNEVVSLTVGCVFTTDINISISDSNKKLMDFRTILCPSSPIKVDVDLTLESKETYSIFGEIDQPCQICEREVFLYSDKGQQALVPDANIFSALLVLFLVLFISSAKKKK